MKKKKCKAKEKKCHDCGAKPGQYHSAGCDTETCAKCRGQTVYCDCAEPPEEKVPYTFEPTESSELWLEFIGTDRLCGLCGNAGKITTKGWLKNPKGDLASGITEVACICPSGRELKDNKLHS